MPPRLLITRPAEDSAPLAERLAGMGYATAVEPMLDLVWLDGPEPDLSDVQALLFTSANGVRGYLKRTARRDRPVYAVGDATARAARDAGFAQVESASGDVYALARLVTGRCRPEAGLLLHVAGSKLAGDLAGLLEGSGFSLRRETLYDAVPSTRLGEAAADLMRTHRLSGALFFSPRTARSFVRLVAEAGLADACRTVDAFCLSPAVAEAVSTYGEGLSIPWRSVRTADRPEQEALLALLPAPTGDGAAGG